MKTKSFVVYVDGIYVKDKKILVLKRSNEPFKGFWHVIGGKVKDNETLKEALIREFKEETNLDVEVGEIVAGRFEETFDQKKIIVAFKITSAKGEIKLNSESKESKWVKNFPPKSVYNYFQHLESH